jgi:lipoprotein-anchoring transpeptidase ErfK/SrfK
MQGLSMRRSILAAAIAALSFMFLPGADRAQANVLILIDRGSQTMQVSVDGMYRYSWPVSTGRPGLGTPPGTFRPQRMAVRWFSHIYYNSPMPHSIFFRGGLAIHGSYDIAHLGGPASHGCVRLHPGNAAVLYGLVQSEGMRNTTIVVR